MVVKVPARAVCLFGQQLSVTHPSRGSCRTPHLSSSRDAHAQARPAYKESELAAACDILTLTELETRETQGPILSKEETERQLDLHSPVDLLRQVLLHDMVPNSRQQAIRSAVQRALCTAHPHLEASTRSSFVRPQFPVNGELISHDVFRDKLKANPVIHMKSMRWIMREQLLRCQTPQEILRVVAVAMQRKSTAASMAHMHESLRRSLYRSRNNVTDADVLSTINVIIMRLKRANLPIERELLKLGIKFAARARSLSGMKRYLKDFRDINGEISKGLFRAIIAKFSIGSAGLGEIRNGRWRRQELLQVLLGFEDTPPSEAHHLGVFLQRNDWQFLHGWLAVLARCKAVDEIWREWQLWLSSPTRIHPKPLRYASGDRTMNTRARGDYWFVEQMCFAGDIKRAWIMLKESEIPFARCREVVRNMLLSEVEHATTRDEEIRNELLKKYASDLDKIEAALGVRWVSRGENPGFHILDGDMADKLERLAEEGFKLDPEYGYPWPEPTDEERNAQRNLMEAEEEIVGNEYRPL